MKQLLYLLLLLLFLPIFLSAQHGTVLPKGNNATHLIDRLEIKTGIPTDIHTAHKGYTRDDVTRYALHIDTSLTPLSKFDRKDLYYIFRDNNDYLAETSMKSFQKDYFIERKKPLLKHFYKTPANFLEFFSSHFHVNVNPIFNFRGGKDARDTSLIFQNTRGFEVRGSIDDKVWFYTSLFESQSRFLNYTNQYIRNFAAIPQDGFYKQYHSSLFDSSDAFDYLNSEAYLGFKISKHISAQFGHGRNFIGNGYRSMILSDFSNNYLYVKLNTRVWKFHYQNIFAETLAETNGGKGDRILKKKYFALHHLSFDVTKNFNIGLTETIVFSRENQFELQYLNPVILYRTVEHLLGSPDNALIAVDFKYNFLKRFSLYGQVNLDEFNFKELILERNGWWANKYGIQVGLKYIDVFGVDHLDAQVEYNMARPYTYSHRDSTASFSHYNQSLAHPLGANFNEVLAVLRYQPIHKLTLTTKMMMATQGLDSLGSNWGGNILISHNLREMSYGNKTGQGVKTTTLLFDFTASYMIKHNIFIDFQYLYRNQNADLDSHDLQTNYIGLGLRMNVWNKETLY